MQECIKCGVSGERELLFDAISDKGIVKICKKCAEEEKLPLIGQTGSYTPEKTKTVYERLSSMANLDAEKHRRTIRERDEEMKRQKQNKTLKEVVDDNYNRKIAVKPKARTDLIDNFHWVLMRVRRAKKLTQKQLAEEIGETEATVKMAEEGFIPDNSDTLVRKFENYFGIRILRNDNPYSSGEQRFVKQGIRENEDPLKKQIKERFEKEGDFDPETSQTLTISDLQEIKKKKETEGSGGIFSFFRKNKKEKEEKQSSADKKELSNEETNEILFGED